MDLDTGVCGICNSNSLILKPEYSINYCNLIYSHFEKELNISGESRINFNLCPTCVYQITLINSKKNSLVLKDGVLNETEVNDKCALCKQNGEIFKITDTNFLNKCKSWISSKNMVSLCASCFYIIELDNVLKNHVMQKLSIQNEAVHRSQPKLRTILKRRKSTYEVEESSSNETNESEDLKSKKIKLSEGLNSMNSKSSLDSTPVKTKRRRSKNLENLLDKESKNLESENSNEIDEIWSSSRNEAVNYDLSSISQFLPLYKTDIQIDPKYKLDEKIYNCIPFVKMENFDQTTVQEDENNYVCSLVSQRPMIRVRRTPPIKIKTIKKVKTDKKNVQDKKRKQSISKIQRQKLIVKVERMKLDIPINDKTTTPKTKKRVHFDDTPTIIIAENDYYDDHRNRRNNRNLQEQPDKENVEIMDEISKQEDEKSDSEELITLSLEESDDESNKEIENQNTEGNTEEMNSGSRTSEETSSKDHQNEDTEKLKKDENSLDNGQVDNNKDLDDIVGDECVIEETEKNSDDSKTVGQQSENKSPDRNDILDESLLEKCGDPKIHVAVDISTRKTTENGETSEECEENSEINLEVDKNTEESTGNKSSADNDVAIECEDSDASSEDKRDHSDDCQIVNNSENIDEDNNKNEKSGGDNEKEISTVEKPCPDVDIHDNQVNEESVEDGIEKTCSRKNSDLEDEKLEDESLKKICNLEDEKTDEGLREEKDGPETVICQVENIENENEGTEKDSLDGFEVIDQDNGDLSNGKVSSDEECKEESTDVDDIETLMRKYCEEDKEENTVDNGAQSAPEVKDSQLQKENDNSTRKNEQENEGFGPLIDEVQKCLTSKNEILDSTKEGTEDQDEDLIPNSLELAEILNSSFDEKCVDRADSSQTETTDSNLKRKNTEDEVDMPENKREKIDNS